MRAQGGDASAGLAGYAWRAPEARAAVLLQHGYAEHAGLGVTPPRPLESVARRSA